MPASQRRFRKGRTCRNLLARPTHRYRPSGHPERNLRPRGQTCPYRACRRGRAESRPALSAPTLRGIRRSAVSTDGTRCSARISSARLRPSPCRRCWYRRRCGRNVSAVSSRLPYGPNAHWLIDPIQLVLTPYPQTPFPPTCASGHVPLREQHLAWRRQPAERRATNAGQTVGLMFWLWRKRFCGSYFALIEASRL